MPKGGGRYALSGAASVTGVRGRIPSLPGNDVVALGGEEYWDYVASWA